jgi:MFS family permease
MSAANAAEAGVSSPWRILDRNRIIAKSGFNRWLVPPSALAIHLCIGMAYGFSVFWLPLTRAVGGESSMECPQMGLGEALFTTSCDWRISDLGWMYTLFFVFLGISAAVWGGWLERAGPRKAGVVAAIFWSGGMAISALGIFHHQLWLMWLGSGVIGGIGLGLGYISPVSTLIKWFPDRRGMATGMAIMGFGGGAMIGAPLAQMLMNYFGGDGAPGVWQTFLSLGAIYFVFMIGGAFGYRIPPPGWKPKAWTPPVAKRMIAGGHVHLKDAHKTQQFWLIWAVLCLNVSAGIGVIGMASPMLQEIFGGRLIDEPDVAFTALNEGQLQSIALIAAGFTGLLSLFNIAGRFFWASLSDIIGRKTTYYTFFLLGIAMYASAPLLAHSGALALFVLAFGIILSMYGGGFATVPAYLADIFGTQFVGAIHGRLLTAWGAAGIFGPVIVNYIREAQIAAGVSRELVYDFTLYILAGMLALGFLCNLAIKPLDKKWFMSEEDLAAFQPTAQTQDEAALQDIGAWRLDGTVTAAWLAVGIPIAWGIWITMGSALALFG